ncbi:mucin-5AC-like [Camponotus floridanus]|uniref:mucin-5AC-like n=1 Tax=Camponotus floridanus TaxID=104421 RepID=UPI000DC693A6|nr:mucin-5AC-like [Camponotus floridanus]
MTTMTMTTTTTTEAATVSTVATAMATGPMTTAPTMATATATAPTATASAPTATASAPTTATATAFTTKRRQKILTTGLKTPSQAADWERKRILKKTRIQSGQPVLSPRSRNTVGHCRPWILGSCVRATPSNSCDSEGGGESTPVHPKIDRMRGISARDLRASRTQMRSNTVRWRLDLEIPSQGDEYSVKIIA